MLGSARKWERNRESVRERERGSEGGRKRGSTTVRPQKRKPPM